MQVFRDEGLIYMVLEYGDIDLAHLLHNHEEARQQRAAGNPLLSLLWQICL
jgi:serine/threonine-protein kinase TTK/MPS1